MLNLMCPYREAFCPMSSKRFPIDQQNSEPSSLTTMNLWTKRQVCVCITVKATARNFKHGSTPKQHKHRIPVRFHGSCASSSRLAWGAQAMHDAWGSANVPPPFGSNPGECLQFRWQDWVEVISESSRPERRLMGFSRATLSFLQLPLQKPQLEILRNMVIYFLCLVTHWSWFSCNN